MCFRCGFFHGLGKSYLGSWDGESIGLRAMNIVGAEEEAVVDSMGGHHLGPGLWQSNNGCHKLRSWAILGGKRPNMGVWVLVRGSLVRSRCARVGVGLTLCRMLTGGLSWQRSLSNDLPSALRSFPMGEVMSVDLGNLTILSHWSWDATQWRGVL